MIAIENSQLLQAGGRFVDAFNELASSKELDTVSKMTMIKLRKQIAEHITDIRTMVKDLDEPSVQQLLKDEAKFDLEKIDANLVIDLLTADQIFVLSGSILTEV